jgi:hypothetical protein
MDATDDRYAYRCLPLLIANQAGWFVLNDQPFACCWDGTKSQAGVKIRRIGGKPSPTSVTSHFGEGIITFHIPYLFRTPPGYNLLVRGPANWPKDGVQALEGLVEADWTSATFTMNWKITRAESWIKFSAGEPICMIVPQRRGELEAFEPRVLDLERNAELRDAHKQWSDSRSRFLADLRLRKQEAVERRWQKDYFQGRAPGGNAVSSQHQTVLKLQPFEEARQTRPRRARRTAEGSTRPRRR